MKYLTWKTIDGTILKVVDMTDEHLCNVIKMLQRKWDASYKYACDHVDDHTTISSASDCSPAPDYDWFKPANYDSFILVAKGRGLQL